ncbi:carbohydrate sulfotransferase 1-like [Scleropages formosus]|uniref:carbohydrate sulfotransferase 1-like n=1 Tax=Scleropages formosus TaxID=113540 RepID=UPI0010FA9AE2|nr:carbohydrate sulfotransferase 1-like [Scleropages formosus]
MRSGEDLDKGLNIDLDNKSDTDLNKTFYADLDKKLDPDIDKGPVSDQDKEPESALDMKANHTFSKESETDLYVKADAHFSKGPELDLNMRPKKDKDKRATSDQYKMSTKNLPAKENPTSMKTHILIFATTRSGSSFLGQLFNHHPDVFYLFEPLFHIERSGTSNHRLYSNVLRRLFDCNLRSLERYIKPRPKNHITNQLFRRESSKAMCSPPVCTFHGHSKLNMNEKYCQKICPSLNLTLASEVCRQRQYVVIKAVRISEINTIRALVEDPKLNMKIIQLVRDPRGILSSRISTFGFNGNLWRTWKKTGQKPKNLEMTTIVKMCDDFFTSVATAQQQPSWLKGKYMLVRYEDLALNPIQWAKKILTNTKISLDSRVFSWLQSTINGGRENVVNRKYGTVRNSTAEAEDWRLKLPYVVAKYTQTLCERTLKQLSYKKVNSEGELKNMSLTLIENRKTFEEISLP